jgi:hypothetical protein
VQREPVTSSAIASVGYDRDTNVLELEFVEGYTYRYFAVPASVHAALMESTSLGTFFAHRIRHTYSHEKIS